MINQRFGGFNILPAVVKNLLIINGLVFLFLFAGLPVRDWMMAHLALHFPLSPDFIPTQLVTYQFMHSFSGIGHLFFNMFSLWMFGSIIENTWGPKRFLSYYIACGIGAALFQLGFTYIQYLDVVSQLSPGQVTEVMTHGHEAVRSGMNYIDPAMGRLNAIVNGTTVGASGAIYGILVAFGYLYPNNYINLYFLIPIKAKYFVILMMAVSLLLGLRNSGADNVAHFAHLGGGLVGFLILVSGRIFRRRKRF